MARSWRPLVATTLVAAACTQGPITPSPTDPLPTTTTSPITTTTVASEAAVAAFEICLATEGLVVEPIPLDATGRPRLEVMVGSLDLTDPATVAALAECSGHLTHGALDLSDQPLLRDDVVGVLVEFSECVRSRGVPDFPDPVPDFDGVGPPYPADEIPYDNPRLGAAVDACRPGLFELQD